MPVVLWQCQKGCDLLVLVPNGALRFPLGTGARVKQAEAQAQRRRLNEYCIEA